MELRKRSAPPPLQDTAALVKRAAVEVLNGGHGGSARAAADHYVLTTTHNRGKWLTGHAAHAKRAIHGNTPSSQDVPPTPNAQFTDGGKRPGSHRMPHTPTL